MHATHVVALGAGDGQPTAFLSEDFGYGLQRCLPRYLPRRSAPRAGPSVGRGSCRRPATAGA